MTKMKYMLFQLFAFVVICQSSEDVCQWNDVSISSNDVNEYTIINAMESSYAYNEIEVDLCFETDYFSTSDVEPFIETLPTYLPYKYYPGNKYKPFYVCLGCLSSVLFGIVLFLLTRYRHHVIISPLYWIYIYLWIGCVIHILLFPFYMKCIQNLLFILIAYSMIFDSVFCIIIYMIATPKYYLSRYIIKILMLCIVKLMIQSFLFIIHFKTKIKRIDDWCVVDNSDVFAFYVVFSIPKLLPFIICLIYGFYLDIIDNQTACYVRSLLCGWFILVLVIYMETEQQLWHHTTINVIVAYLCLLLMYLPIFASIWWKLNETEPSDTDAANNSKEESSTVDFSWSHRDSESQIN